MARTREAQSQHGISMKPAAGPLQGTVAREFTDSEVAKGSKEKRTENESDGEARKKEIGLRETIPIASNSAIPSPKRCTNATHHVTAKVQDEHVGADSVKKITAACPVLGLVPVVPWLVACRGGARSFAPVYWSLLHGRLCTESHSGAFLAAPMSRKVHGVNAIGAPAESHAPLRGAGGVSRRTIRRVPSTWCQSPGEHVSGETAHAPSLSQRVQAVLQHCVRRFAVASNAEHGSGLTECSIPGATTRDHRSRCLVALFATTLETTHCNNTWWLKLKDNSWSPFVSSQGVVSPPLPNGCGRELHGLQLYKDQSDSI